MSLKYMPVKLILLLGVLAFAITLAIIIGQRLSTEAMAVLMGVVAGVAASIPTSLIVVWIAMQTMVKPQYTARPEPRGEAHSEPPRVVVVQQPAPGSAPAPAYAQPNWGVAPYPLMPAVAPRPPRKFTVIGGVAESEEPVTLEPIESEL
jgi:hypothetical protein